MLQCLPVAPRSRFDLLPTELTPFIELVDEASKWLNFKLPEETDQLYQPYLEKLNAIVDDILPALDLLKPNTDGAFEAALALFTVGVHQYRWKHVPVMPSFREIKSMVIPPCFHKPLLLLTTKVGLPIAGSVYAIVICNYDASRDGPRFLFNTISPEAMHTEKGWTKMLWTMEDKSGPFLNELMHICETLDLDCCLEEKEKLVKEQLANVRALTAGVFRTLHEFASKGIIGSDYFAPYIEGPHGWGIEGLGGASGAQMLPVTSLDAILSIKGEGMMYRETIRSRESMTYTMRDYLSYLDDHATKLREFAYLEEFVDLVRMVYNFRLGHRKIGIRFLEISDGTAGGKIQLYETKDGNEMVAKFKKEMGIRINENASYLDQLKELYGPLPSRKSHNRTSSVPSLPSRTVQLKGKPLLRSASDSALNLLSKVFSIVPMADVSLLVGSTSTQSSLSTSKETSKEVMVEQAQKAFIALMETHGKALGASRARELKDIHRGLIDALVRGGGKSREGEFRSD